MSLVLAGARIFDGDTFLDDHAVVVDGARIAAVVPARDAERAGRIVRLDGGLLAPGYIDVQVNGGGGALLNDSPSVETVQCIADSHRRHGTTGLLPTVITDAQEVIDAAISAVKSVRKMCPGVLGIHIEGPFLDVARKGAHDPKFIRRMSAEDVRAIAAADCGAIMVTVAPNRVAPDLIRLLANHGVFVSLGHSDATAVEARAALAAGARSFTHLFNAMSQMTGREPGMVGAALADAESFIGFIPDGFHVDDTSMKIAFAAKSLDRFMIISDAMPPAAGGPDQFMLQDRRVTRKAGRLQLDDGTLAGSNLTMDEAVRYCVANLGITQRSALRMASLVPARFLKLDHELGAIKPGYIASLVHLNLDLHVQHTWINGS